MNRLSIYSICLVAFVSAACSLHAQQVAITFDDLPAHSVLPPGTTRLGVATEVLKAFDTAHVPPTYGFVNAAATKGDPSTISVLDAWRTHGDPLGSHTWSHMSLDAHTTEEFEADIVQNEPILREHMAGADWKWLRFPYLQEGDTPEKRTQVRRFLAQHGYRIAAVTMSFGDYLWNEPYARCSAKGDARSIQLLEDSYLKAADEEATYERTLAHALYGHDIPYVLLMHIGAFDARMLPRLLALYKERGFHFVLLQEAEKDPFYNSDTNPNLAAGPSSLAEAATLRNIPSPKRPDSNISFDTICR